MQSTAQRLQASNAPMREYPQSVPNLTAAGSNLFEIIKGANLIVYPDDNIRLAISRTVAKETARGYHLTKEKTSHKIDVVIALAMASLAAVERGQNEIQFSWGGIGCVSSPKSGFPGSATPEDQAYAASRGGSFYGRQPGSVLW